MGSLALRVDHIGSTAVPGLLANDCIDDLIDSAFKAIGFRRRPESWNRTETSNGRSWPKLVFAPPAGECAANVHVRPAKSATARRNLLFRDFLRDNAAARNAWGAFKQRLALTATDLYDYGQIKQPATELLMLAAQEWARQTGWTDGLAECATAGAATAARRSR